MSQSHRIRVFISHADADTAALEQLKMCLVLLERRGDIRMWDESQIEPGTEREKSIAKQLQSAQLFICLVSVDYLASEKCLWEADIARMREPSGVRTLLILLRPCEWRLAFSDDVVILPSNGRPITKWSNRDEAWLQVLQAVQRTVVHLGTRFNSAITAPKSVSSGANNKPAPRGKTLLPHESRDVLQGKSNWTEPPDTTPPLRPPITELVGQRIGSIFATNQPALRQLHAATRLAVEAEHEGSEERARVKRRLAAVELLASIDVTLLWRFDRMRIAAPTRDSTWSKASREGVAEATNWLFNDCIRTHQDPSLELIGIWMFGPARLTPGELLVAVRAALGISPGLEHDVYLAGKLQHAFDNWSQWQRKQRNLSELATNCENLIGVYIYGATVEIDIPESTISWLEWLGKCLLDRGARPRPETESES